LEHRQLLTGILSITPDFATPGTEDLQVTIALDANVTPPPPPSFLAPSSVEIDGLEGSGLARNDTQVTAVFDIPSGETAGVKDVSVSFPGPFGTIVYTLPGGFNVTQSGVPLVSIAATDAGAAESGPATGTFTVSRSGTIDGDLSVALSLGGSATEGDDFAAVARTAVIPDGQSTAVLTLTPIDDDLEESSETVTLSIAADTAYVIGTSDAATVRIADDDGTIPDVTYVVVDTGQTTFYDNSQPITAPSPGDAFYGQDAQFDGNQPSYTLADDGLTVSDNLTGLTWTQNPDLDGDGDIDADDKLTFAAAQTFADTLNAEAYGGFDDWRLPSMKELYSLMDFRGTDPNPNAGNNSGLTPFIDTDYFDFGYGDVSAGERIIDSQFWSSNAYVGSVFGGQPAAFGLNLADGRIKGYPSGTSGPVTKMNYVYFVRGNPDYGVNAFADNGDGTITDAATGLMWSQDDSGDGVDTGPRSGMNWEDALAWVQQMNDENYLGHDDWRLPDAKELQSIVDYSRAPDATDSGAIDPIFNVTQITNEAGQADYPWFWTGTTHVRQDGSGSNGVYLCFGRSTGYMQTSFGGGRQWLDVHGAGAQRSDQKDGSFTGLTYAPDGYYLAVSPQGDATRSLNYVRLVRDAEAVGDSVSEAFEGYTLYSPLGPQDTYLIDNTGQTVHSWTSDYGPALSTYLLDDGTLMRTAALRGPSQSFNVGGAGGRVERFSFDGALLWAFEYSNGEHRLHHDVEVLPNGNVLMIAWELVDESDAIAAGRDPSLLADGELWPDQIIEVEPTGTSGGNIVWQWRAWDHLVQDFDPTKANYGVVADHPERIDVNYASGLAGADLTHVNSIDYNAELDQILLSVRSFDEIWVIDHGTTTAEAAGSAGDLLYRWGNPQTYDAGTAADRIFFGQHDAEWIGEGLPGEDNILVFNNGSQRAGRAYSSVDEINPPLTPDGSYTLADGQAYGPDELAWSYTADPASSFYADHISGSQRLPNGNTLITDGTGGLLFEVTAAGQIVWQHDVGGEVFRADRYGLDYSGVDGLESGDGGIYGYVWNDADVDQLWGDGEAALEGWTVYVDANGNGQPDADEPNDVTDAAGYYEIGGLTSDTHTLAQVVPAGWAQSWPGEPDFSHEVTLTAETPWQETYFGNDELTYGLYGYVWDDTDADQLWGEAETALEGWTVYVDANGNGQADAGEPSDVTDAAGYYEIGGLAPGTHTLAQVVEDGWAQTWPGDATLGHTVILSHETPWALAYFGNQTSHAEVIGRHVFYNNSAFDGDDPAANVQDDQAIAIDKIALLPGQAAAFANYTSFHGGINGVMIDVAGLPPGFSPEASHFQFAVGNADDTGAWLPAPEPIDVALRAGAGVDGSDRITLVWADHAVRGQWLQVTALADAFNLATDDVFHFGNAVAESGNSDANARITATDLLLARNNPRNFFNPAGLDDRFDYNRDQRVNATDLLLARNNQTNFLTALRLIDLGELYGEDER